MLKAGDLAPSIDLTDAYGQRHSLATYAGKPLMVSFYRNAACPLCNLRIYKMLGWYPLLRKQGLVKLAIFESPERYIRMYVGQQKPPFPILADHSRKYYQAYQLEKLDSSFAEALSQVPSVLAEASQNGFEFMDLEGSTMTQLPADFLILPNGRIHTAFYASTIAEHVPIEQVRKFIAEVK